MDDNWVIWLSRVRKEREKKNQGTNIKLSTLKLIGI